MTRKDIRDFSRILVERWPQMRFLTVGAARYYLGPNGEVRESADLEQPPPGPLVYLEDLADPRVAARHRCAFLKPASWEPEWMRGPFARDKTMILSNKPSLCVSVQLSSGETRTLSYLREHIILGSTLVYGQHPAEDVEAKRFLASVMRMLTKFTTKALVQADERTGRATAQLWKGHPFSAGPDAVRWACEDPMHFFEESLRPASAFDGSALSQLMKEQ